MVPCPHAASTAAFPRVPQLGHKSAALTLDTYADLFPNDLEAVADALDAAVLALRESTADALRTDAQASS